MAKQTRVVVPVGMSGLAVEPWSKGDVYAVAANWAQAGSPVMVYGNDGWELDGRGRQVADFRHSCRDALESIIREAIEAGGDEPDDDEVEGILDDATEIMSAEAGAMCDMLERHGPRFTGNNVQDEAQDWIDHGFSADDADGWCEIGCWDAGTAAEWRDAGKQPHQIQTACEALIEAAGDDVTDEYTDGDPIYSACNGDTKASELTDAAE